MKPPRRLDATTPQGIADHLERLNKAVTNISFGSTLPAAPGAGGSAAIIDPDMNFDGHKAVATSPAAPNTEFAVNHSLGRVPMGFVFLGGSNQGLVYRSATAWTATQIFLKETQGSNTFVLLIV